MRKGPIKSPFSVGPTVPTTLAPGHGVLAWASLCSSVGVVFSGAASGPVSSRVSNVCRVGCSCATAVLTSAATSPSITTAAVTNTLNRRMCPPKDPVVSLLLAPPVGASPLPFVRSAPHRLVGVYESPTVKLVSAHGSDILRRPLYLRADLKSRAVLGSEQAGQGRHVRGRHARARLSAVAPSGNGGQDLHPRGGHVNRCSKVREGCSLVLLIGGGYGDHVLVSRRVAWPVRVLVAGSGHDDDPVIPGV